MDLAPRTTATFLFCAQLTGLRGLQISNVPFVNSSSWLGRTTLHDEIYETACLQAVAVSPFLDAHGSWLLTFTISSSDFAAHFFNSQPHVIAQERPSRNCSHHLKDLLTVEGPPSTMIPSPTWAIWFRQDLTSFQTETWTTDLKGKEPGSNLVLSDDWAGALGSSTN